MSGCGLDSFDSGYVTMVLPCDHDDELSASIEGANFLHNWLPIIFSGRTLLHLVSYLLSDVSIWNYECIKDIENRRDASNKWRTQEMLKQFWFEDIWNRDVDERMMLNHILKNWTMHMYIGFNWLGIASSGGLCSNGAEHSVTWQWVSWTREHPAPDTSVH
jgi:hypothetical protein